MSRMHTGARDDDQDELERLIREGVNLDQNLLQNSNTEVTKPEYLHTPNTTMYEEENEDEDVSTTHDLQGALGLYAEAAADMATAGVELGLGRHFACADFCNQAVAGMTPEKLDAVVGPPNRKMTGYEWLWAYFTHTAHHRGQLTVYLRLNDIPVPAIYGPSADEGSM